MYDIKVGLKFVINELPVDWKVSDMHGAELGEGFFCHFDNHGRVIM